ncbi:MAG TPA: thioredoxin family protein [Puia sp.]|nr:thioredoxin family protein [Puia sp.]
MNKNRLFYGLFATLIFLISIPADAQDSAIAFESGLSWNDVSAKAKAENKYIFMDCYATWCGPCKWMSQHIFQEKEAANFFNTHFINVAVQMDRTPKDLQSVRDWYSDADSIKKDYEIQDYPTYLFFSPDGKIVHRLVGSAKDSKEFISKAVDALDPSRQSYTMTRQWERHKTDSAFLWEAFNAAQQSEDFGLANSILEAYLNCQADLLTKKNLKLIADSRLIRDSQDKWFQLFLNNAARINDYLMDDGGMKNTVAWVLRRVIRVEELEPLYQKGGPISWGLISKDLQNKYPSLGSDLIDLIKEDFTYNLGIDIKIMSDSTKGAIADWNSVRKKLSKKYPDFDFEQIFLTQKANYFSKRKLWKDCAEAAFELMHRYDERVSNIDMNNIIWEDIFEHCRDRRMLSEATKWMRNLINTNENNETYLDTYANLLYKSGNKDEALKWEKRAIEVAEKYHVNPIDLKTDQDNFDKMQQGQPTWTE